MFSPDIICSEEFLEMPVSCRDLYIQLAIRADDDGFIQPKIVMRMIGSDGDDLKILIAKRFLLAFDDGVVVIKHWLIHNIIRSDRYKATRFQEQKKMLQIKDNKSYTELGLQNDNQMATQVRLGKDRIGEKESVEDSARPPKTYNNFRDQARARIGNPPMEKMVLSEKQQGSVRSMKLLSRVHDAGVESGYDYLNEEDEQANKKYQGQVKPFEKRYPSYEEQEQYIKWFFNDPGNAWTDGHPSHFFSVSMWLKFDNRKNTKTNKSKGMAL